MRQGYVAKKRNTGKRKRRRIVLLAVEGNNKTETNYFRGFDSKDTKIIFASGNDTDPINMANSLVEDYKFNELDGELGDAAFCVVDGDVSRTREKQVLEADRIVKKIGSVIVSNPCIEVWFLCHFTPSSRPFQSSKEAVNRLKECIPGYEKNMDGLYDLLEEKQEYAINNAKALDRINEAVGRKLHHYDYQPSTEIYKIINYLSGVKGNCLEGLIENDYKTR